MSDRTSVEQAIKEHAGSFAGKPNVVGVGMQRIGKEHVLVVYVSQKIDSGALPPGAALPKTVDVENRGVLKQVSVKVVEQGSEFNLE